MRSLPDAALQFAVLQFAVYPAAAVAEVIEVQRTKSLAVNSSGNTGGLGRSTIVIKGTSVKALPAIEEGDKTRAVSTDVQGAGMGDGGTDNGVRARCGVSETEMLRRRPEESRPENVEKGLL